MGCALFVLLMGFFVVLFAAYLIFPARHNVLLLGIDYTDPGSAVGRSDTLIMTTFAPQEPYVGMLSIPRDLWVIIPHVGENRINTAHFYAEANQAGSGPQAVTETIGLNFGLDVDYYVRVRFDGFKEILEALGGVDILLAEPMAGYEAGKHHLTPNKALAFVRHRQGSDDFFRMENTQLMVQAIVKNTLNPLNWPRLPAMFRAFNNAVDTNIPFWAWPRLAVTVLRVGPDGIDNRTINRDMVTPFFTDEGANVLAPNWLVIKPVLNEMFDR